MVTHVTQKHNFILENGSYRCWSLLRPDAVTTATGLVLSPRPRTCRTFIRGCTPSPHAQGTPPAPIVCPGLGTRLRRGPRSTLFKADALNK